MKKFQIKLKSTNFKILFLYKVFILTLLKKQKIQFNIINLPKKQKKITLLKSPHVYKKARKQFELKTYKYLFQIKCGIQHLILKFLLINKPSSVFLKIKRGE